MAELIDGISIKTVGEEIPAGYVPSFEYKGKYYLLGALGTLLQSDTLKTCHGVRRKPLFEVDMRHLAVWPNSLSGKLRVFWSRVGDAPEHILMSELKMTEDWNDWKFNSAISVAKPTLPWEGCELALEASLRAEIGLAARELRDSFFFQGSDGKRYLFYVEAAEQAIALIRL